MGNAGCSWRHARAIFLAMLVTQFCASAAVACSLPADYEGPRTNFELVQQADVIVVATLVKSLGNDQFDREILVTPTLLLKGSGIPANLKIRGYLSDQTLNVDGKKLRPQAKPSEAYDLWRPHPEVWTGGCSRYTFAKGMQLLLFFKKNGSKLEWFNPPFTRSSEDVSGVDALWVRAVKTYVRIGRLPAPEQNGALKKEMNELREMSFFDDDKPLLADDIERQLAGIGPVSNFDAGPQIDRSVRWSNNISNEIYSSLPNPIELKDEQSDWRDSRTIRTGLVAIIGILALAFSIALYLKAKLQSPRT